MLRKRLPDNEELDALIELCETCEAPLSEVPAADSAMESAIIACASHVFLQTSRAPSAAQALERVLGETGWQYLTVFLAFVHTAHYWTRVHPELRFEDDLVQLTKAHEQLAECLLNDPEAQQSEVGQRVAQELADLRAAHTRQRMSASTQPRCGRKARRRFRLLFESMEEGFCVIEVQFDVENQPFDYRFLEVNPAFEQQTGIKNAKGRLMREIVPEYEQHWFDVYGRIALTGETLRFENQAAPVGRWCKRLRVSRWIPCTAARRHRFQRHH